MANATTRDARAGFAIYLQSPEDTSLDTLNARLRDSGYGPIAQRTLTHYRNLARAGFNRYISINRFDVARASRAYENLSSLGRYRYHRTHRTVDVLFAKNNRLLETKGQIIEVGDVGAILEFTDDDAVEALDTFRPRSGDSVSLRQRETAVAIAGSVIDSDLNRVPVVVEIEYDRLLSVEGFTANSALATAPIWIRIQADELAPPTLDTVGRRLHYFFDLLEALRAVFNEAGRQCDTTMYASPPTIQELRLASPALLLLQLPPELAMLMPWTILGGMYLLPKTIEMRKTWHEGTAIKKTGSMVEKAGNLIDKAGNILDTEVRLKELEVRSKEREDSLHQEVVDRLRNQIRESKISDRQLDEIIDAFVLPSFRTIEASDIQKIETIDGIDGNSRLESEVENDSDDENDSD